MNSNNLEYNHGYYFPIIGRIIGLLFVVSVVVGIINHPDILSTLIGILFLMLGLSTQIKKGLTIDYLNNKAYVFKSIFGIKINEELDLRQYKYISLLNRNFVSSAFTRSNFQVNGRYSLIQIVLLSENHRKKIIVNSYTEFDQAKVDAIELAKKIKLEFERYNPPSKRK
jgi:hypothetical protein